MTENGPCLSHYIIYCSTSAKCRTILCALLKGEILKTTYVHPSVTDCAELYTQHCCQSLGNNLTTVPDAQITYVECNICNYYSDEIYVTTI